MYPTSRLPVSELFIKLKIIKLNFKLQFIFRKFLVKHTKEKVLSRELKMNINYLVNHCLNSINYTT